MLVVSRVLLALRGARVAGHRARLERRAEDAEVGLSLTDQDSARSSADISAVETKADAADHLPHVRLAEVDMTVRQARFL